MDYPPDLVRVIKAWPALPEHIRQAIFHLIRGPAWIGSGAPGQ
jgi:hypothetical protein